jgi:putative FmdB family regulatory protein
LYQGHFIICGFAALYNPFIIMPIYAYKCGSCGFAKDVLQKISDAVLTECPSCGQSSFTKQLTAAGFQLKGSGWYATDFKGGSSATTAAPAAGNDTATHLRQPRLLRPRPTRPQRRQAAVAVVAPAMPDPA